MIIKIKKNSLFIIIIIFYTAKNVSFYHSKIILGSNMQK